MLRERKFEENNSCDIVHQIGGPDCTHCEHVIKRKVQETVQKAN